MSEPRKFAPMYHSWYLKIRNWGDRQRLLFFDTLCKITWEGYTAREGAEDFEYYCDIYPFVWKPEQDSGASVGAKSVEDRSLVDRSPVDVHAELQQVAPVLPKKVSVDDLRVSVRVAGHCAHVPDWFVDKFIGIMEERNWFVPNKKSIGGSSPLDTENCYKVIRGWWKQEQKFMVERESADRGGEYVPYTGMGRRSVPVFTMEIV